MVRIDSAIDVREYPFPSTAIKPGQKDQHALGVTGFGFSIGILYAWEPFNEDGVGGVHISVSYCKRGVPDKVTAKVLQVVRRLIEQQQLRWPERYERTAFENGPFAGCGEHLWEQATTPTGG
jgi:hypothetical protein